MDPYQVRTINSELNVAAQIHTPYHRGRRNGRAGNVTISTASLSPSESFNSHWCFCPSNQRCRPKSWSARSIGGTIRAVAGRWALAARCCFAAWLMELSLQRYGSWQPAAPSSNLVCCKSEKPRSISSCLSSTLVFLLSLLASQSVTGPGHNPAGAGNSTARY